MDDRRFDALARALGRRAFAAVGAGGLAAALNLSVTETDARKGKKPKRGKKKKQKCKKPKVRCGKTCCGAGQVCSGGKCAAPTTPPPTPTGCRITKTATTWTLLADCSITETLEIPNGVTFNGNSKTITMTGSLEGFRFSPGIGGSRAAGILVRSGVTNIENVTVTSRNLVTRISSLPSLENPVGIALVEAAGTISDVHITGVVAVNEYGSRSGGGIFVTASGGEEVEFDRVAIDAYSSEGIELLGLGGAGAGLSATIARSVVAGGFKPATEPGSVRAGIDFEGAGNCRIVETEIYVNSSWEGLRITGFGGELHGTVEQTVIRGQGQGLRSFKGIVLSRGDGEFAASISDTAVQFAVDDWQTVRLTGIEISNPIDDHLLKTTMTNVTLDLKCPAATGLLIAGNVDATLAQSTVTLDVDYPSEGVYARGFNSELTPNVTIDQTTVESLTATSGASRGIVFDDDSSGALQATTISGFRDTNPDPQVQSCGLDIAPGVTVDYQSRGVTFTNNENDVCGL